MNPRTRRLRRRRRKLRALRAQMLYIERLAANERDPLRLCPRGLRRWLERVLYTARGTALRAAADAATPSPTASVRRP